MDNGLIFPYPCIRAQWRIICAKRPELAGSPSGDLKGMRVTLGVVVKRWGDAGR